MKTLILMRHAKSSWDDPRQTDHQRPLNGRGRASALKIGHWLKTNAYLPTKVVLSDSTRTRETLHHLGDAFRRVPAEARPDLYHASPQLMLGVLRLQSTSTVLMIGHNPGIAALAEKLAASPPDHGRFHDYPTCATTVYDFDAKHWNDVETGEVMAFQIPGDL